MLDTDRRIENLLRAQAASLHVGPANYCWFRDPSKALCLRLAGTMQATRPLIGLCDSARCPQATHHVCHRPIWAEQAATFQAFLGNPRVPAGRNPGSDANMTGSSGFWTPSTTPPPRRTRRAADRRTTAPQ